MRYFLMLMGAVVSIAPSFAIEGAAKEAAEKGAAYLQKHYAAADACEKADFKTGEVALAGLALMEAGYKPDDPAMANIIRHVRKTVASQYETYHLACCILFFDKLDDLLKTTANRPWIHLCGVRLYAGMNAMGGWTYACWEPVAEAEAQRWTTLVENAKDTDKVHPEIAKLYAVIVQTLQARGRANDLGDNSNTQFGLVGLWIASRHGLNIKDAFPIIERRFLGTWHKEGGWSYRPAEAPSSMPMTCAGLLGLAVGEASRVPEAKPEKAPAVPVRDDPFFNPKKPAEVRKPVANAAKTEMIQKAILGMGQAMAASRIRPGTIYEFVTRTIQPYVGTGNLFYLLWSVERCAVAYSLDTFADVDWYSWGCDYLFALQTKDGSWAGTMYNNPLNTSFAILFLHKSNSFRDLTGRIAGRVKDPGVQELRATPGSKPLFDPKANPTPTAEAPKPNPTTPGSFTPVAPKSENGESESMVKALLATKDSEWPTKLATIRDGKGSQYTDALVKLASSTDGERRKLVREHLAERLTRMTPKSLQAMLESLEPELRRAAALACGMRELQESVPWLIARLADPSDAVFQAALASLKSLSGKDFGPDIEANEEERLKASAAWRQWYDSRGK